MSTDRYRIVLEREPDASWSAELVTLDEHDVPAHSMMSGSAHSSSPGEVLERIGQRLDELEAARLDREHGFPAPPDGVVPLAPGAWAGAAQPATAEDRELAGDVARVLEVLEDAGGPSSTLSIAGLASFARSGPMGDDGRMRALRALRQAEADDVVELVGTNDAGDYLWTLSRDDDRPTPDVPY